MNKRIIPMIALVSCLIFGSCVISTSASASNDLCAFDEPVSDRDLSTIENTYWFKQGYFNIKEYQDALAKKQKKASGSAKKAISKYSSVITDKQKKNLKSYEIKMVNTKYIGVYDKYSKLFNEIIADCKEQKSQEIEVYSYEGSSNKLTRSAGVNYFNGRRETWYSSNVLYHYRTSEWSPDANGVYRDSNGYVVVAASDLPQGSTVSTSHGMGKVYDSGCPAGTTDIYVNW